MTFTKLEFGIAIAIMAVLGIVVAGAFATAKEKERFVAECSQHEPSYECEVKWKQMHPDPLIVFAPLNR